jgi:4-hydroxy-2-oxoheptanedioate aldolase
VTRTGPGFTTRLRRREALRLLFVKLPCPAEIELAGSAGFDAVILDTEHGATDGLEHHLRAADAVGVPALVRVPNVDPAPILRALDAGAVGIVVAHVNGPEEAHAAVAAAHYPPRGRRGLALTTRAGHYGVAALADHLERALEETVVIVQIEDAEAVAQAPEILAVEGVDAVLVGETDLSVSLGRPGDPRHPDVVAASTAITSAAHARGVPAATVVASAAAADAAAADGIPISVFVSTLLIRDAFQSAAAPTGVARAHAGNAREPLVLLPGMLGTAALWDELAPMLRHLVPLRFGRTDLDASIDEMAESVLASVAGRFALAGHSLGAIVALAVVRLAPERVSRLALLHASAQPPTAEQLVAWDELDRRARKEDFLELADDFARDSLLDANHGDASLQERIAAMARGCGPRVLVRQLAGQRSRADERPGLAAISCPTLIVAGAEDRVCPRARQDELAALIPGARLECLERVGHYSPLEAPDRVAAAFARWLA